MRSPGLRVGHSSSSSGIGRVIEVSVAIHGDRSFDFLPGLRFISESIQAALRIIVRSGPCPCISCSVSWIAPGLCPQAQGRISAKVAAKAAEYSPDQGKGQPPIISNRYRVSVLASPVDTLVAVALLWKAPDCLLKSTWSWNFHETPQRAAPCRFCLAFVSARSQNACITL
jgi:hypothetical protein